LILATARSAFCTKFGLDVKKVVPNKAEQEGQHLLTGQRAANFRLLANQLAERRLVTQ